MPNKITDPELLAKLNKPSSKVADPAILKQLDNPEFSIQETISNIPSSGAQFLKDIVTPVLHPIDTAKGLAKLGGSAMAKGEQAIVGALPEGLVSNVNKANNYIADKTGLLATVPESRQDFIDQTTGTEPAEAVGRFFADRYGSTDKTMQTLMKDPVGLLSDAAGVLTAGGALAPKIGKVGAVIDPVNAAVNTGKYTAGLLTPKALPQSLYKSAAKFSNSPNTPDSATLAKTAIEHKIMPTAAGVGKLEMGIAKLGGEIDQLIKIADARGIEIPKAAVFKHLSELRQDLGGAQLSGAKSKKTINKIAKQFDEHMKDLGKDTLTPSELQSFKQGIYEDVKYGNKTQKGTRASEKAQKAIAKAAKEIIEQQDPGIKKMNEQLGELLDLRDPLYKTAGRVDNRNPISIDSGINTAAGGVMGGPVGAVAGSGLSLLAYPKIQAGLSLGLDSAKGKGLLGLLEGSLPLALGSQGLFQTGRERNAINP